uniref:Uncharacterized protein n=1 Tax=Clytia hemisphaerica TaxID=252671 RepID=A0A7M5WK77_9CNID
MGKHGRRHSFDYSCSNDYEVNRFYEQEKQRKVHFDDEYLASRGRKQTRGRSQDGDIQEMGIYETTSKLKESYQNIDKGLDVLRRIYENLLHSKESVRYHSECSQKTFLSEINTLLSQVNELEKSLRKSGNQKREYLEELTRLQQALREDRSKFEASRENRHELHEKMKESTKQTREQQITINKLKKDNENLWRILQEVKKHLLEEDTIQREGQLFKNKRFQLPYPPSQEKTNVECELFPIRDNNSVSSLESAGSSTTDVMLSEKLKYLISRSENIQSMISKVGEKSSGSRLNRSFSDDCLKRSSLDEKRQRPSRFSSCERTIPEEKRIPAENERGVRCDAKDILRRCEELEKRVEQCSTKDMRDRLMCQLEEMERDGNENLNVSRDREDDQYYNTERFCERSKQSDMTKTNTLSSQQHQQQKWHPEVHKKVRGELFKCLDQMSTLEKNFTDAQTEITRLRQYIKETSEHKDFSEKTFKREAIQLRMVVDEKSKEVEVLKQNLNDAIKGLRDSEELIAKVDELERDLEDKEREIKRLKSKHRADYVEIEDRFEQKCTEAETLKTEMRTALEAMERIRVNTTQRKESMRIEETITTEISMLQAAIIEVEERMNMLSTENSTLKIDLDEKLQILGEVTIENEELINRLHACEIELQTYQSNQIDRQAYPLNLNAASYVQQTKRIRQLESDLSKALSEKESILNSTLRNNSYVRIDKTSDEQGQVIESLIDDNEKHLETIQTKDRIIDELQKELRRLNQDSSNEKGSNDSKESVEKYIDIIQRKTKAIEDLRDQLDEARAKLSRQESDENSKESTTKYIDIIQRKTKTIEGLRDQLDDAKIKLSSQESDENSKESIAKYIDIIKQKNQMIEKLREEVNAESDKKLINDLINTLSSKANDKDENNSSIEIELQKIKKILSSSHKDLVGKIITLEEGVDNLRNENRSLRKQMTTKSDAQNEKKMDQQFHQVIEENATLRESLNKPYPGLVQNILLQTDEVKRLHEENELLRLGLSDNKRELVDSNLRKRQRIKDMQTKIAELENERSGSGTTRRVRRRSFSMNEDLVDANQNSSEIESQLRKMEDEKIKMAEKTRQQNKEIRELKDECKRLGRVENSKKALEYEVKNLRDALKNFGGSQPDEKDQKIKDLEEEITVLREELGDGGSYLVPDMEGVLIDSKTKDDLHRMAKIADRERKKAEELQQDSDAWRREKRRLEHAAEESQQNVLKLEDELCDARRDLSRADDEVKQAVEEITKLRDLLEEKTSSDERETEIKNLTDDLNTLQDDRVILQNKLEQVRQKNILLDRENKSLKTNLQESNADNIDVVQGFEDETAKARDEIIELSRELDYLKQQNKELQDINETLVEEVQKMKAKSNETHFKNWLDQDVERRLALLSPDTHRSDLGLDENERQMKKDQQRLIRKLQIENQIMRAKLLSLEEENIASTKIISDMERGHGHLTGTLRSHLILQQHSTAKLLENALQQYTTDYESLKKKFVSLEEKYDRKKGDNSKQRDDIWELFTNAGATITNINTILNEGLVKVDEDLEKDEYGNDFDARDYKSRLWILRRRLSDVENRHRELQLRAEELNLRLDAKQTEFEVTQDELEDATRDLETRENHVQKLKTELDHVAKERSRLARLMNLLKQNQDRMVGDVIADNEALANEMNPKITEIHYYSETGTGGNPDLSSLIAKLKERDTALNIMRKMREENDKENDELKRRINYLERKLKEMTDQRDKLQKEAEYRAGYMSFARDEYGTIHMLRDDLKRIAKENADLKNDIVLKQRQMYDMSKDLHKLRIKLDTEVGSKTGERAPRREENVEKLINDLASNKAEKFVLETKLKDMERRLKDRDGGTGDLDNVDGQASDAVRVLKQRLVDKEREIEKLKRGPISRSPSPTKSPMAPRDDTMSDVVSAFDSSRSEKNRAQLELKKRLEEVVEENKILTQAIGEKGLKTSADYVKKLKMADKKIAQQRTEINTLNNDNEQKRKRIRELLTAIEEIKDGKSTNSKSQKKVNDLINKTKEDEMSSVLEKLKKSKSEVAEWKTKAESYHQELEKVQEKTKSNDSRDFLMDQELHFDGNEATLLTPELPRQQEELANQEPLYEELEPGYETMYEIAVDGKDASSKKTESTKKSQSRIPVSPVKRLSGKSGKQTEKKSGKES